MFIYLPLTVLIIKVLIKCNSALLAVSFFSLTCSNILGVSAPATSPSPSPSTDSEPTPPLPPSQLSPLRQVDSSPTTSDGMYVK